MNELPEMVAKYAPLEENSCAIEGNIVKLSFCSPDHARDFMDALSRLIELYRWSGDDG